jgi:hypothetical protein
MLIRVAGEVSSRLEVYKHMQKSAWFLAMILVMAIVAGCAQEGVASGEAPDAKATPKGERPAAGAGGNANAQLAD